MNKMWIVGLVPLASLMVLSGIALTRGGEFVEGVRIGLWVAPVAVVFLVYPFFLRDHERRLARLERSAGRDASQP